MAPSSSGLGHQVLILKIAGSNPAGVTNLRNPPSEWIFLIGHLLAEEIRTGMSLNGHSPPFSPVRGLLGKSIFDLPQRSNPAGVTNHKWLMYSMFAVGKFPEYIRTPSLKPQIQLRDAEKEEIYRTK